MLRPTFASRPCTRRRDHTRAAIAPAHVTQPPRRLVDHRYRSRRRCSPSACGGCVSRTGNCATSATSITPPRGGETAMASVAVEAARRSPNVPLHRPGNCELDAHGRSVPYRTVRRSTDVARHPGLACRSARTVGWRRARGLASSPIANHSPSSLSRG